MNIKILPLLLIICNNLIGQVYYISGVVSDSVNGEFLIGTYIVCVEENNYTTTNNYGFFSIKLNQGVKTIKVSYIGYETKTINVFLHKDTTINIKLKPIVKQLEAVTVTSKNNNNELPRMSYHKLKQVLLKNVPNAAGISDVLKTIQLLPGVQTTNEGIINFNVRGGSYDQNLILIDEAPIYNPSHTLGFISTINTNVIKDVNFYKGDFPAKYGGRTSSIIDIRLKEGNNQRFSLNTDIGLIMSGLTFEGPIVKNKASFLFACRYSYAGWIANNVKKLSDYIYIPALNNFQAGNDIHFYDLNGKINFNIGTKDRIYISGYKGYDFFYAKNVDDKSNMEWGNSTITVRWNHVFSNKLFMNTSLIYSSYFYNNTLDEVKLITKWSSAIENLSFKNDLYFYYSSQVNVTFGIGMEYFFINPGIIEILDTTRIERFTKLSDKRFVQPYIYFNNEQKLSKKLLINYGLRFSIFGTFGNGYTYIYDNAYENIIDSVWYSEKEFEKLFYFIEPRVSVMYEISNKNNLKFSYARTNQGIHLLSNTSVSLPKDVWIPADKNIYPVKSDIYSIGFQQTLNIKKNIIFSIESYYKEQYNIIDYIDNADLKMNKDLPTQVRHSIRFAYGIETMIEKNFGKLTGWISVCYSHVKQKVKDINNGLFYFPRYEKPYSISILLNYNLSKRISLNSVFKFSSGGYITIPAGVFYYNGGIFNYYNKRNGYELPFYHRLDLGVKILSEERKKLKSEWNIGIYNIYNRKNIFSLYSLPTLNTIKVYKMYVFGITPYITYSLKF